MVWFPTGKKLIDNANTGKFIHSVSEVCLAPIVLHQRRGYFISDCDCALQKADTDSPYETTNVRFVAVIFRKRCAFAWSSTITLRHSICVGFASRNKSTVSTDSLAYKSPFLYSGPYLGGNRRGSGCRYCTHAYGDTKRCITTWMAEYQSSPWNKFEGRGKRLMGGGLTTSISSVQV